MDFGITALWLRVRRHFGSRTFSMRISEFLIEVSASLLLLLSLIHWMVSFIAKYKSLLSKHRKHDVGKSREISTPIFSPGECKSKDL